MPDTLFSEREARIAAKIVTMFAAEPVEVTREACFVEDLKADSLDMMEFVMDVEEEWDIRIDDHESEKIVTVQDAFDLIASKL